MVQLPPTVQIMWVVCCVASIDGRSWGWRLRAKLHCEPCWWLLTILSLWCKGQQNTMEQHTMEAVS